MGGLIKLNVMPQHADGENQGVGGDSGPAAFEISQNNAGEMLDGGKIEDPNDDQDGFDDEAHNGEPAEDADDPQNEEVD